MLTAKFVRGAAIPSIEGLRTLKTRSWITALKVEHPDNGDRYAFIKGWGLGEPGSEMSAGAIGISPLMKEDDAKGALEGYLKNTNPGTGLPEFIPVDLTDDALQDLIDHIRTRETFQIENQPEVFKPELQDKLEILDMIEQQLNGPNN